MTCQANVGVAHASPNTGRSVSDKKTTAGISSPTPPPPPVSPAPRQNAMLSPEQAEEMAQNAVSALIEATEKPGGRDEQSIRILKNLAVCAAEINLHQQWRQMAPNLQKVSDAERLWRQAHETMQGRAETNEIILEKNRNALFAMAEGLKRRLNVQPFKALTESEKKEIDRVKKRALNAAIWNQCIWDLAREANTKPKAEPYGDLQTCNAGLNKAVQANEMIIRIAKQTDSYVHQMDAMAHPRVSGKNR